jgi:periplasmic divalent cation tolerance protein
MDHTFAILYTTVNTKESCDTIISHLLNKKLTPCVQVSQVQSSYVWEGKIEHAQEFLLSIKFYTSDRERLKEAIKTLHPYQVPEIIEVSILAMDEAYQNWFLSCVEKKDL